MTEPNIQEIVPYDSERDIVPSAESNELVTSDIEVSSAGVDEPLLSEQEQEDRNDEKSSDENAVMIRKSRLGVLIVLLVVFMALSAYFFFTSSHFRKESNGAAQLEDIPRDIDCGDVVPTITQAPIVQVATEATPPPCEFTADDVANLQAEIDRLEGANDQLEDQLDDYEGLLDRFNASIQELKEQNEILKDSNAEYEELNGRLSDSIEELKEQNEALAEQVDIYTGLNQDLNVTAGRLEEEVDRLEVEVDGLTAQNDRLESLVDTLANETDHLWELSNMLQENVDRLDGEVEELSYENDRLEALTADLETVASFLNETSDNLAETYDEVAAFLAEQISTNRFLVLESLQNAYHQRVSNWDCALRDQFALEEFANNGNIAIPDQSFQDVISFVEERVLSDLCLDLADFEEYMSDRYSGQDITANRLVTSVQRYTWSALDYYFPEGVEQGLTAEDWAAAAYQCDNLSVGKKFLMN